MLHNLIGTYGKDHVRALVYTYVDTIGKACICAKIHSQEDIVRAVVRIP